MIFSLIRTLSGSVLLLAAERVPPQRADAADLTQALQASGLGTAARLRASAAGSAA